MGDRGNVVVKDGNSTVYLYTHWDRWRLGDVLKDSLIRGEERWNDGQYLARIIFEDMIKDNLGNLTGYGISSVIGDGDETFIVDTYKGTVNDKPITEFIGSE